MKHASADVLSFTHQDAAFPWSHAGGRTMFDCQLNRDVGGRLVVQEIQSFYTTCSETRIDAENWSKAASFLPSVLEVCIVQSILPHSLADKDRTDGEGQRL